MIANRSFDHSGWQRILMEHRLRPASESDREFLLMLHRITLRDVIEATWGWDEAWQQTDFNRRFAV